MAKRYYMGFKTADGDGTDDDVTVQLYDVNGKKVGGAFEVSEQLHDVTGNALSSGSYQMGIYSMSEPETFDGIPDIYFLEMTIDGSDSWTCEYVQVALVPAGWYDSWDRDELDDLCDDAERYHKHYLEIRTRLNEGAKFSFNEAFSTDEDEGVTSRQIARDGYKPQTIGAPTPNSRTSASYDITDNIGGSAPINSAGQTIQKIRKENISLQNADGGEQSNSLTVGVTVGYKAGAEGGAESTVSTTYQHAWKNWHSRQRVRQLEDTTSQTYTFPSSSVPAHTLRISNFTVDYTVSVVTVSNGIGHPAKIELIGKQGLTGLTTSNQDITQDNAQRDWATLKAEVLRNDPSRRTKLDSLEAKMRNQGWLT
ncbi:MAG: hypothetical protein AAF614_05905 [Chloroflexota bacterium]